MAVKFQGGKAVQAKSDGRPEWATKSEWDQLLPKGQAEVMAGKVPLLDRRFKDAVFNAGELSQVITMMRAKAITPKAKAALMKLEQLDRELSGRIYSIVAEGFLFD